MQGQTRAAHLELRGSEATALGTHPSQQSVCRCQIWLPVLLRHLADAH